MLRFIGGKVRLCDGLARREVLRVGGIGALTLWGRPFFDSPARAESSGRDRFGQARSVVFICLYGGPPQTETFDMKPNGPDEARGPFRPIATAVPGLEICEHLPQLAKVADQYALVRSFTHEDTAHASGLYTHLTGWPHPRANTNPPASSTDYPHYGSVMGHLRAPARPVPPCVIVGGRILPQFQGIGQTGGFLGAAEAPYVMPQGEARINHYGTILSAGHGPALSLPEQLSPLRLTHRQQLLAQLEDQARLLEPRGRTHAFGQLKQRAFAMLTNPTLTAAFDLEREPDKVRDNYGRHFLGQNLLLARRLVEASVPTVQVSDIPAGGEQHWDLHYSNIFDRLKNDLLPQLDQAVHAFLTDLQQRGLLDQTLVIVGGEFGRTPWIDREAGQGGRQHWPRCYSMLLAGGGIRGGQVFGASDRAAAYPTTNPVGPWDLGATLLHLAGFDPASEVFDPLQQRQRRICEGTVIRSLL
ncbi:MAG: DUF1501 domain-containing protein [Planctomycetes bacterium]|nr:DUF1501 domain-containing protein [Planctomycetota bacterium]